MLPYTDFGLNEEETRKEGKDDVVLLLYTFQSAEISKFRRDIGRIWLLEPPMARV